MPSMPLKDYQQECLDKLRDYLRLAGRLNDGDIAFYQLTRREYRQAPAFGLLPYICLRVPTGGGKTLIASHAVPLLVRELLQSDRGIVLWLAPTTKIVDQTLRRLRDPRDPYRLAAEAGGPVRVMTLAEALYLSKADTDGATVIIVMPIQALRVDDTEGRKIYEDNGQLMGHFEDRRQVEAARERLDWFDAEDRPVYSLANVLAFRRGTTIVDEAHNARTPLTFKAFDRLKPAGLLELTATPREDGDHASNVLYGVSAAELKAEEMVKLPVMLTTRPDWRALLTEAVEKRAELERLWRDETAATGETLRPILLVQAQSDRGGDSLTPEVVKAFLTSADGLNQPEAAVRVVTGKLDELGDDPAGDVGCEVSTVVTQQKLREGWDCPAAYVLCSVADLSSDTAAEQMLGRVLRMPSARRKQDDRLNRAYAYVTGSFRDAAERVEAGLVSCGMERYEAARQVRANAAARHRLRPAVRRPGRGGAAARLAGPASRHPAAGAAGAVRLRTPIATPHLSRRSARRCRGDRRTRGGGRSTGGRADRAGQCRPRHRAGRLGRAAEGAAACDSRRGRAGRAVRDAIPRRALAAGRP